jgi:glycosidase
LLALCRLCPDRILTNMRQLIARSWWFLLFMLPACAGAPSTPATPASATEIPATPAVEEVSVVEPTAPAAPICRPVPAAPSEAGWSGWWNDTVFYEIFVRSYYDSDGDGVGDINGLISQLDYLNDGDPATDDDLGVTGLWLMPINESPSYHGYDVVDYFAVDQEYGTLEDFQRLLEEAHARGIRVIIDLVLNHTSTHHPWFEEAAASPDSAYRDYYIFEESSPGFRSPWGSEAWHASGDDYYYGVFWSEMPDLNYANPVVTEESYEIVRFWLEEVGVDGLRLDAIKHLIENGDIQENTPATHEWFEDFYTFYKDINPEAFAVGEAWTSMEEVLDYTGDEVDIAFEFETATAMLTSVRNRSARTIAQAHQLAAENFPPNQFATFLTNHDQDRTMSVLLGDVDKARAAATLLLAGPGVPFVYYGEEIGQRGRKPDENIRRPLQWSDEPNAGFSTASIPWRLPYEDYTEVNIAAQTDDHDSLLSHYRRLIHARNNHEALRTGDWVGLPLDDFNLYAFLRRTPDQTLLVLVNLSDEEKSNYALCWPDAGLREGTAAEVLTGVAVTQPALTTGGGFEAYMPLVLEAYGTAIIELR